MHEAIRYKLEELEEAKKNIDNAASEATAALYHAIREIERMNIFMKDLAYVDLPEREKGYLERAKEKLKNISREIITIKIIALRDINRQKTELLR